VDLLAASDSGGGAGIHGDQGIHVRANPVVGRHEEVDGVDGFAQHLVANALDPLREQRARRLTLEVGGQLALVVGQFVPAGGVHEADAGFDTSLESVAAAEIFGVVGR